MMASAPASAIAARVRAASSQFVIEDERVERDEALDAAPVQGAHHFRQFGERKPDLGARGEMVQAEIDRVRARFDGGAQLRPVSGRTHDFGLTANYHGGFFFQGIRAAPLGWRSGKVDLMRLLILFSIGLLAFAQNPNEVRSPDGNIVLAFSTDGGQLAYTVSFRGKPVMDRSALGLEIQDQPVLGPNVRILGQHASSIDETYSMPHGKANPIHNVARALSIDVEESRPPLRKLTIEARAYNDGVAFRYVIPSQPLITELRLVNELTEFNFAKDATTYPLLLRNFRTSYEDNYHILPLSALQPESLAALPFTAEVPGTAWVAITEADIDNYAGMYLQHNGRNARSMFAKLAPSADEPGISVRRATPVRSAVARHPDRRPARTAGGIDHDHQPQPAFRHRRHVLDQARQDFVGLVERQLRLGREFPARHEHCHHGALHRLLARRRECLTC